MPGENEFYRKSKLSILEKLVQGSESYSVGLINCFFFHLDEQCSVFKVYSLRYNVLSSMGVLYA